ncbi:MAG: ABC transporter substrate-binding protein [Candidatus Rokubacteria bacterium]|nr:ABC transporter substrate-binding protein [Candidatus Rokubacteria bacterium]
MRERIAWSVLTALLAAVALASPPEAAAQGSLNVYCSVQLEWCQAVANEFTRQSGIKVAITQKGSGEVFAQIKAEAANPKADVWFGGTGDPHLQAAEEGLTAVYKSPALAQLHPWAVRQAEQSGYRTVGIYAGALGFSYNTELLKKKSIPPPRCWADLLTPAFKGEIQMANPASSGTAYTAIATVVQVMGEAKAFEYLKQLHANINQYTKSGVGPVKAAARGETLVGISFVHDVVTEAVAGFPVASATPCEGTGYEIGSLSIVSGARNVEGARRFVDWALTAPAQALGARSKQFQMPSNRTAEIPKEAPKLSEIKLIDYDFKKYGSSAERRRLIDRWDKEVNSLPR